MHIANVYIYIWIKIFYEIFFCNLRPPKILSNEFSEDFGVCWFGFCDALSLWNIAGNKVVRRPTYRNILYLIIKFNWTSLYFRLLLRSACCALMFGLWINKITLQQLADYEIIPYMLLVIVTFWLQYVPLWLYTPLISNFKYIFNKLVLKYLQFLKLVWKVVIHIFLCLM